MHAGAHTRRHTCKRAASLAWAPVKTRLVDLAPRGQSVKLGRWLASFRRYIVLRFLLDEKFSFYTTRERESVCEKLVSLGEASLFIHVIYAKVNRKLAAAR